MKNSLFEIILNVTGKPLKLHILKGFLSEREAREYALREWMYSGKMQDEVSLDGYGVAMFSGLEIKRIA